MTRTVLSHALVRARLAALWLLVGGCTTDSAATPTQVMVVVSAEAAVRAVTKDVRVVVRSGQGDQVDWEERLDREVPADATDAWPIEVSLTPKNGDATRVYEVTATALDDAGADIARVRAISGFVEGKALQLALVFDEACIGKVAECDETETCRAGICDDADVDVTLLPPYSGEPQVVPPNTDGGLSTSDGSMIDAAQDAGSTDADTGVGPSDASILMDSGASTFPDVPNFDIDAITFEDAPTTDVDCGDITIDTTGPNLMGWCGQAPAPIVLGQTGGPALVVIPLTGLNIPAGRTIRAIGTRPVAFVVEGDVVIDGVIDASAEGATPGAGGNVSCTVGTAPKVVAEFPGDCDSNQRGGGGGGFGTRGGRTCSKGNEGQAEGNEDIVPLRGGCAGYSYPYCTPAGGAGGGAVQIVVSGTLTGAGEIRANGGGGGASCPGATSNAAGSGGGSGGAVMVSSRANESNLGFSVSGGNGGGYYGGNLPPEPPTEPGGLGVTDPTDVTVADTSSLFTGAGGGYGRIKVSQ